MDGAKIIFLTATDKWQIEVLQEAGYLLEDIQKEIADKTKKQVKEIQDAMEDAGVQALQWDDKIYQARRSVSGSSPAISGTYADNATQIMRPPAGEWRNFTRTTANEAQRLFINQMDNAYNMVVSGAVSYTEAVQGTLSMMCQRLE